MKLPLKRHTVEGLFNIDSENDSLEVCMNTDVAELEKAYADLEKKLKDREDTSIGWSVDDFMTRAWEIESEDMEEEECNFDICDFNEIKKRLKKYDPDKFEDALYDMMRHHDATIGITWDTIDYYLDEYCLREEPEVILDHGEIREV